MITKSKVLVIVCCIFLIGVNIFALAQENCLKKIPERKGFGFIYDCVDLSNKNLDSIPNLSGYKIKELNLSHNKITEINWDFLPRILESLNLSYNNLENFELPNDKYYLLPRLVDLSRLDISHNKLTTIKISYMANLPELKDIRLNHNKLIELPLGDARYVEFLDVSDNPKLSNKVFFHPEKIKTIKSDNIANKEPLIYLPYTITFKCFDISNLNRNKD